VLPGTAAVYPNTVHLWRTAKVLREEGGVQLPERARHLLEGVYGEDNPPPPEGLMEADSDALAETQVARSSARFNALDLEQGYARSDNAPWDDDQEVGTRFSNEPTIRVVLVQRTEEGLRPWHAEHHHPWAMSTLNLREGLANRLPGLPADLEETAAALCEAHPQLRYSRFWLPDDSTNSAATYDPELGAVIPRGGGERSK